MPTVHGQYHPLGHDNQLSIPQGEGQKSLPEMIYTMTWSQLSDAANELSVGHRAMNHMSMLEQKFAGNYVGAER